MWSLHLEKLVTRKMNRDGDVVAASCSNKKHYIDSPSVICHFLFDELI